MTYLLCSLVGLVCYIVGYKLGMRKNEMARKAALLEVDNQLVTILKHEGTIETLEYVAREKQTMINELENEVKK